MAQENNSVKPLLERLLDIESNISFLKEKVSHPESKEKLKLFERKLEEIEDLRGIIIEFQNSEAVSRQNFIDKFKKIGEDL
ncbi:MAG: hypothetical protein MI922_23880, partial [Bacteroidales bacterium]|nr:hypothetical protein [Bacteroidales bacterium]